MSLHEEFLRWDQTNPDDLGLLLTQQPEPLAHASLQLPRLDLFPPPLGNKPSEKIPSIVSILSQRNFYDCSKVEATYSVMKSRLACVRFAQEIFPVATKEEAADTLEQIMDRLSAIRKCMHGGCGIPLKCATYFTFSGQTWFGLVADGAQLFRKWHQVFHGLNAAEIKVFYRKGFHSKNSIMAILEMFPGVPLAELMLNQRNVVVDIVEETRNLSLAHRTPASKKRSRKALAEDRGSPSSCSPPDALHRRKRGPSETTPVQARAVVSSSSANNKPSARCSLRYEEQADENDNPVQRTGAVVLPKIVSAYDDLANSCVLFLANSSLEACPHHEACLRRYLEDPRHRGRMGLFLLDNGLNELFTQACYLKDFVFTALHEQYSMSARTLSTQDITNDPGFCRLDAVTRDLLFPIMHLTDCLKRLITFALYDRVSVLVFLSMYILRCHHEGQEKRVSLNGICDDYNTNFLSSEAHILGEIPYAYANMIHGLQAIIRQQILLGHIQAEDVDFWLPPVGATHESILENAGKDLAAEFIVKTAPNTSRINYRINKFTRLMADLQRQYKIFEYGVAVQVWRDMQAFKSHFHYMRASDQEFLLLPITRFCLMPESHSTNHEDMLKLTDFLKSSKRLAK